MHSFFKKLFIQVLLLGLFAGLFFVFFWEKEATFVSNTKDCREVQIAGKTFILKRAFTPETREMGLSWTQSLPEDGGMIFEFEESGLYSFWMKDMIIAIDIIFVETDTITDIYKSVIPESFPLSFLPTVPVNFVIELNAGEVEKLKIDVGEKLKIFPPKECIF